MKLSEADAEEKRDAVPADGWLEGSAARAVAHIASYDTSFVFESAGDVCVLALTPLHTHESKKIYAMVLLRRYDMQQEQQQLDAPQRVWWFMKRIVLNCVAEAM